VTGDPGPEPPLRRPSTVRNMPAMALVVGRPLARTVALLALALVVSPGDSGAAEGRQATPTTRAASSEPAPLSPEHRAWLEEVAPLISDEERDAFVALAAEYQRGAFIEAFWRARDPYPETARNELREPWEARLAEARQRFEGLDDDRVRFFLLLGEPSQVFPGHCGILVRPLEVWRYRGSERVGGGDFYLVFSRQGGRYRAWDPRDGLSSLVTGPGLASDAALLERVSVDCTNGLRLAAALGATLDWAGLAEAGTLPARPSGEWLRAFLATTTVLPDAAQSFDAELTLSFPGSRGGRTVVQGVVEVPRSEATLATDQGPAFDFVVDGEVLRKGERFESFRYRFRVPAATSGDTVPLVFQRPLRPGSYRLLVRVREVAADRWFRDERDLEVPFVQPGEERVAAETVGPVTDTDGAAADHASAREAAADPVAEANLTLAEHEHTLRLLPAPERLTLGKTRVEAVATGERIERVRFLLDGRAVMTKGRPPWSVELDLGSDLRTYRVGAVAVDADGEELARDELLWNAGPHRFAVRLVEPQPTRRYETSLRVAAEVEVPEGDVLERVEIYLDETLLATLYQPPFVQPVRLPVAGQPAYLRTVAVLADGNAVEDVVLVNVPDHFEAVDVHTVELYTTVVDRSGRPAEGLSRDEFRVREEGVEQTVRRFERVDDLSIYAGVMIDTSSSMVEELPEALAAASRFFDTVMRPRDRAALITFDERPRLAVRFTNHPEVLAGGLADAAASGGTALWDSLVFTLHYFSGVQGKKAVVLLSDGDDHLSHYSFGEVLDYARRTGVTIYPIGLGPDASKPIVRSKLVRLAAETGGRGFFVDRATQLSKVYEAIEQELRSQYLLVYQSSLDAGDDFRQVEVEVTRPGLTAKTIRGYYP
jgi:Ca-activated chloride channel homolog